RSEPNELVALKEAAEAYIASVRRWPKGGLDAIKRGLANGDSHDIAANEAALKMICIRAEIVADVPTPAADQPMRREYQVQRLVKSMGQGLQADEAQLDAMAIEWVGVGPVDEPTYRTLLERFTRCRGHSASNR